MNDFDNDNPYELSDEEGKRNAQGLVIILFYPRARRRRNHHRRICGDAGTQSDLPPIRRPVNRA